MARRHIFHVNLVSFVLAVFMLMGVAACKNKTARADNVQPEDTIKASKTEAADKPLIEIKEKMFITQLNDIYLNAEEYIGRRIKLEGLFKTDYYTGSIEPYCFVLRYGPGCCVGDGTAALEVRWPNDGGTLYPVEDDWVEAVGVLDYYEEDGYPYLYVSLSSLTVLDERGAERVLN
ncbi:MAG: hypothetical protein LBH50_00195 [Spirochaetaceae bacterium]|jgi:uncharacterized membrane protein YcgQ (UPF0703/DUF1980 family)|nr:hypothetical protein [Spirochaetaceae bacterium]